MAEFKWISLFLIAALQFTAAAERLPLSFTVRVGDEVTLPCENVTDSQQKCDGTTWLFVGSGNTATVTLFEHGQIGERAKAQSDRLSVTASCSLVIKKVTVEDVGRYSCRQLRSGRQQAPDSQVHLSVVTMDQHQNSDTDILFCAVLTYDGCEYTVEWLYEGNKNDLETSQLTCSATVTFTTPPLDQKSNYYELLKCNVTDNKSGQVLLCNVGLQSSCEKTGSTLEGRNKTSSAKDVQDCSALNYIMLVMRVAELLLITAITVLLIRARGNQRPPDDNTVLNSVRSRTVKRSGPAASQVNDDEDEGVVNYENFGDPSASVRLR
ncbi:uncharacterized protein LOC122863063 isoform X7 [Siniperca chuatsi]|uniref:uncharacterized protein LOC122863063 isoform X7 n=1 Tax=Siniperca chuatsi TaxID=119488 RepID=UPI001CE076E3|nr:uncharacterized protein LOC122863063 isoform X7 [Siniperca chuatsi]